MIIKLLFFACANKSNQKKAHPAFALFALCAKSFVQAAKFLDAPSMSRQETTHILVRRPYGYLLPLSPLRKGIRSKSKPSRIHQLK